MIHETATVDKGATLGEGVKIWHYAHIRETAKIGAATSIGQGCYIESSIGERCKLQNNVNVYEGVTIGNDVFVGPNATFTNDKYPRVRGDWEITPTVVRNGASIGAGAVICPGVTIGEHAMVAAGAVVTKNVPALTLVKGCPAKPSGCSSRELEELLKQLADYMQTRSPAYRAKRYDILGKLQQYLPALEGETRANVYNMAMSLGWQQHEDFRADQRILHELVIAPMGEVPEPDRPASGKMAWLVNHVAIGTYAPFKHVIAYLSALPPCEVYVHGNVRKQEAQQLMAYGHNVTHFHGSPDGIADAITERCKQDNIGALISDIYTAVPLMVFQRRAAPLQVYLSPGFQLFPADLVLLPETQEEISFPRHNVDFIPTAVRMEDLRVPAVQPGAGTFGVLSRPEKMSAAYLEAVDEITLRTGKEFRIYGRGAPQYMGRHFVYQGVRNAMKALSEIGVYLDTFPTCGGLSCFEAMAVGVPVITLDHPSVHSWNEFKPCVVKTPEDFVDAAIMAITDKGYAQSIATKGREIVAARITNTERAAGLLVKALERAGWQG